jgi:hypothetical protein
MQAIAAIILVIVTIIYTVLTRAMARAARDALRPYVYLDFTFPGGSGVEMLLTVGNSGSKAAAYVRVRLLSSTREDLTNIFAPLPLAAIGHLAPGGARKYSLIVPSTLWPDDQPSPVLEFEISYQDGRHKVTDKQRIDFQGFKLSAAERKASLSDIVSVLDRIATNMPSKSRAFPQVMKVCPYCATNINSAAKKCPNCLEWVSGRGRLWRRPGGRSASARRPGHHTPASNR